MSIDIVLVSQSQSLEGEFVKFGGSVNSQLIKSIDNLEGIIKPSFSVIIDGSGQFDFMVGLTTCSSCKQAIKGNVLEFGCSNFLY